MKAFKSREQVIEAAKGILPLTTLLDDWEEPKSILKAIIKTYGVLVCESESMEFLVLIANMLSVLKDIPDFDINDV